MTVKSGGSRIFVAMDNSDGAATLALAVQLGSKTASKIGMGLCSRIGVPAALNLVDRRSAFLDLKFHDIPNTVAEAVRAAALQHVAWLNVHCSGGEDMMRAAVEARDKVSEETGGYTAILGVTVLTSLNYLNLIGIGMDPRSNPEKLVQRLAKMAADCGLDGVVCSPREITAVREAVLQEEFAIVTPGIRDKDAPADDQKRTLPAGEAIRLGATHLVIGRPITAAADPVAAADKFITEVDEALAARA